MQLGNSMKFCVDAAGQLNSMLWPNKSEVAEEVSSLS